MEEDDRIRELSALKLEAEVAKLRAEATHIKRWAGVSEFLKVSGAILATLAAIYAAVTTYRITQLETKLAEYEKRKALEEQATAIAARDSALKNLRDATLARQAADMKLAKAKEEIERANVEFMAALASRAEAQNATSVAASTRKEAERLVKVTRQNLRAAETRKGAVEQEIAALQQRVESARQQLGNVTRTTGTSLASMTGAAHAAPDPRGEPEASIGHKFAFAVVRYGSRGAAGQAEQVSEALKQKGFQTATSLSPDDVQSVHTNVVYYYDDTDSNEAAQIKDVLVASAFGTPVMSRGAPEHAMSRRYFEVWLAAPGAPSDYLFGSSETQGP